MPLILLQKCSSGKFLNRENVKKYLKDHTVTLACSSLGGVQNIEIKSNYQHIYFLRW